MSSTKSELDTKETEVTKKKEKEIAGEDVIEEVEEEDSTVEYVKSVSKQVIIDIVGQIVGGGIYIYIYIYI